MLGKPKEGNIDQPYPPASDDDFAYIAGYTPGGAPYGVTWEEVEQGEIASGAAAVIHQARQIALDEVSFLA